MFVIYSLRSPECTYGRNDATGVQSSEEERALMVRGLVMGMRTDFILNNFNV